MDSPVPKRKRRETWVAYHDRLVALAKDANDAGAVEASEAMQARAGQLAAKHKHIRERPRDKDATGPGTYPWKQCVSDQRKRGLDDEGAKKVCGRIRANSRRRYQAYWEQREANPQPPGKPTVALGLDAGPRHRPSRDLIVLLDEHGGVLELVDVFSRDDLDRFSEAHPGVPIIGPLGVLSSTVRELRQKLPVVEVVRKAPANESA